MTEAKIVKLVVASPGDVQVERNLVPHVVEEVNHSAAARDRGGRLEVYRWETDTYPGFHPEGPQGLIDPILQIEHCDLLIGIFWRRFGTPAKGEKSGTEYEINTAYKAWQRDGAPQIMVYFNEKAYMPKSKEETDQWGQVLEFRKNFPKEALWCTYKGKSKFEELLRNNLDKFLQDKFPISTKYPAAPELDPKDQNVGTSQSSPIRTSWNIPHPRNPFFTGREDVLEKLRQAFQANSVVALCGMGGIGKTEAVVEYVCRHCDEYNYVLWLRAESTETLMSDFTALAGQLGLQQKGEKEQNEVLKAVRKWLEYNPGWLLVLDYVNDLTVAQEFWPPAVTGHVLLTTRVPFTGKIAERIGIDELSREEGALLLLRRAKLIPKNASINAASPENQKQAMQLSIEMEGLPLALDQAAAYIEETPSTLKEYLRLYKAHGAKLFEERSGLDRDHPSVMTTFSIAFNQITMNNDAIADLLRACAFLAPDAIPEEMFTKAAAEFGEPLDKVAGDDLVFRKALAELGRYSLIKRNLENTKTIHIHRLVQEVLREGMDEETQRLWATRCVRAVNRLFPSGAFETWACCERLLSQASTACALIRQRDMKFPEAMQLLNKTGTYLHDRARYTDAEPFFGLAGQIGEMVLESADQDVSLALEYAVALNGLGQVYYAQGQYSKAEQRYEQASQVSDKALGPENPIMARVFYDLARLYDTQGRYEQAEMNYKDALRIWEKILGPENETVATVLNTLASFYLVREKYQEAEPLCKRALEIRRKLIPMHPDVASSINNLGQIYQAQGKYKDAEATYKEAIRVWKDDFESDHPYVAQGLFNLARCYQAQNRFLEAEPCYTEALNIWQKVFGSEHPYIAQGAVGLAELYGAQGRYQEAEQRYKQALQIWEKVLGSVHPNTAAILEKYADLLSHMHRDEEAIKMSNRAKAIRSQSSFCNPANQNALPT